MQQFSGINVTSYYLPTVLTKSVGMSEPLARLLTACNSVQYLCFSMIGIPNVERWGRRALLIFGATGQCLCYTFITALIRYNEMPGYPHQHEVASASVAFFFMYYIFFGIGMQGVPWCMSHFFQFMLSLCTDDIPSVPHRDQLPYDANQGRRTWSSYKLDFQIHGRRDHSNWYTEPWMAILYDLDRVERSDGPCHLRLLSRDSRTYVGGHG